MSKFLAKLLFSILFATLIIAVIYLVVCFGLWRWVDLSGGMPIIRFVWIAIVLGMTIGLYAESQN